MKLVPGIALFAIGIAAAASAQAQLVADGITYTLTETSAGPLTDSFSLSITGINAPADTEQGRYGVQSFAFTTPSGFVSATAPTGFTYAVAGSTRPDATAQGHSSVSRA